MDMFERQVQYWAHMLDESFDEEVVLNEGDQWPKDFIKRGANQIKNAIPNAGQNEQALQQLLLDATTKYKDAELTHTSKQTNLFKTLVKWSIEYANANGKNFQAIQKFFQESFLKLVFQLQEICSKPAMFEADYDLIRNQLNLEQFQKYYEAFQEKIRQSQAQKMSSIQKKDQGYQLVKIDSYEQLHAMFGGAWTGGGRDEQRGWCHSNGKQTYDSPTWTNNGRNQFVVLCKKDWREIYPKFQNAMDDYGKSAIALLINKKNGKLLHNTFRYNHEVEPTNGGTVDNCFEGYAELSQIAGFDVQQAVVNLLGIDLSKYQNMSDFETQFLDEDGNINCSYNTELTSISCNTKTVDGDFMCHCCTNLKSLIGGPTMVKGVFDVSYTGITSLSGGPEHVEKDYLCHVNDISSLVGSPKTMNGGFCCNNTKIQSLSGAPQTVGGTFYCGNNDSLTSLLNGPQIVGKIFNCQNCLNLQSLDGAPQKVGLHFICSQCGLTSLIGMPREIEGSVACQHTEITDLRGAPRIVGGDFLCSYCDELTSLNGAPEVVGGAFACSCPKLTSLVGCTQKVGEFRCAADNLKTLAGGPSVVRNGFTVQSNALRSLNGAPIQIGGAIRIYAPRISDAQIEKYKQFLKHPTKAHIDATGHYKA